LKRICGGDKGKNFIAVICAYLIRLLNYRGQMDAPCLLFN